MHQSIDPELNYCPLCRDEYRADISLCGSCGKELIAGEQLLKETGREERAEPLDMEIREDDTLVALQAGALLDMKNLKNVLARNSVPALLIKDENSRGGGCCGPPIVLHIRDHDIDRAAAVLREEHARTTRINEFTSVSAEAVFDPQASRVVCPACSHEFTPEGSDCPDCGLNFL